MAELVDAVALGATAFGRAGSSPVPGTTETQHPFAEDREALLWVHLDPEAILSEQSAECLPSVFRTATEHVPEVAQGPANSRRQCLRSERSFAPRQPGLNLGDLPFSVSDR